MSKRDVVTFHRNGRWHNRIEGRVEVLFSHDTQEEAVAEARLLARHLQSEHVITEGASAGPDPEQIAG